MNFLVGDNAIVDEREKRQRYGRGPWLTLSLFIRTIVYAAPHKPIYPTPLQGGQKSSSILLLQTLVSLAFKKMAINRYMQLIQKMIVLVSCSVIVVKMLTAGIRRSSPKRELIFSMVEIGSICMPCLA